MSYFANYLNFDYEKEKLLDIFQAFDKNHDGQIDQQELLDGYIEFFDGDAERAEREVQEIMEKLDFNGNGSIDYSEFAIANIDMNKLLSEDKLKEAFELFDIDRGGSITTDEIKKILGNGNKSEIDDNEWERILDEVDADGNGEIDFEEFKHMMYKVLDVKHKAPYTET